MKLAICALVLLASSSVHGAPFKDRKIFVSKFAGKPVTLAQVHQVRKQIHDEAIKNLYDLNAVIKKDLLQHAEDQLKIPFPIVTAEDLLEFTKTGNRDRWERKEGVHQKRLSYLVVGNVLSQETNKSSTLYLEEIVNGIWQNMELTTWSNPAHMTLQGTNDNLPDPGRLSLDLSTGEMAKRISWYKLLLADKLDQVTPVINKRIDAELSRRVLKGFLDMDGYFWEGFTGDHVVNNWNIWLNGNILKTAIYTSDDIQLINAVLNKTLYSADYFLDGYGEDGGCDEGPTYWRQAGGRLVEYLESLAQLYPDGKEYFASIPLLKLIGDYSYKMLIDRDWYVNYADSLPVIAHPPSLIAKYGNLLNDESMKEYAGYRLNLTNERGLLVQGLDDINEYFNYLETYKQIHTFSKKAPYAELVWLPDLEVVNVRSKRDAPTNFFLSAKSGNNHESHNHNDVGNFVLYQNGHPVLIDIGVGTYTAQTFNSHRYELFYMQSAYHNCPTINGVQQHDGNEYNSHNTSMKEDKALDGGIHFSSDIAGSYPKEAKVKSWLRSVVFDRSVNTIQIDDQFQLDEFVAPQQLHFITLHDMKVDKTDQGLTLKNANASVNMDFDWKLFALKEEDKSFDGDHHLMDVWGASVKRITLTTLPDNKAVSGHFTVKFSQAK